jgi:hypothetical protein
MRAAEYHIPGNGPFNMTPIAYGIINGDATTPTIIMSTPNVTAVGRTGGGTFDITINGITYDKDTYVALVTLVGANGEVSASDDGSSKLRITTYSSAGAVVDGPDFYFVIYKP